ncbi:hypothetical protein Dxin01_01531 [Deinococcus xinjiangensis]|uniref:DinB-like domain-containing protein n=1 Tax=Deinococcus xinjiangensis TaxID=457454 RepID=A0ABP9V937_9DEIO
MPTDQALRGHIRALLTEPQAHATLDDVLAGFPLDRINERPQGLPYSAYELLWHLRFAQRDILNFVRDEQYHHVNWPDGYWPHTQQATKADWDAEIAAFKQDFADLLRLLDDPQIDLFSVVPSGDKQTWLREFLLVADHNAYHIGQLALLKRLLS